jgi:putative ABC transport system permease protein
MIPAMAWRNIWRNKMRSLVIMLSVAVGLFAAIAVLALYKGMMQGRVRTVIDTETGHIQIHHPEFKSDMDPGFLITYPESIIKQLESDKSIRSYSARVITTGMLSNPTGSSGVQINGVDTVNEAAVSGLAKKIREGGLDWKKNEKGILVGKKLASKMKLTNGTKIVLTMTDTAENMVSAAFRIKGIFQSANAPLDEANVYVDKSELQQLLGIGRNIHEIAVILNNDDSVSPIQHRYQTKYENLLVESWQELSPETDLMVKTVDTYSYIIVIIILIALSFGIINTMMMTVLERRREIGMMVALGTGRGRLMLLILLETFFLTIVGIPVALIAGFLVTGYYQRNGLDLSGMGRDMMQSFGFDPMIYPSFPADKLTGIIILVFLAAVFSSLFPAWKSLQMNPAETLQK